MNKIQREIQEAEIINKAKEEQKRQEELNSYWNQCGKTVRR